MYCKFMYLSQRLDGAAQHNHLLGGLRCGVGREGRAAREAQQGQGVRRGGRVGLRSYSPPPLHLICGSTCWPGLTSPKSHNFQQTYPPAPYTPTHQRVDLLPRVEAARRRPSPLDGVEPHVERHRARQQRHQRALLQLVGQDGRVGATSRAHTQPAVGVPVG